MSIHTWGLHEESRFGDSIDCSLPKSWRLLRRKGQGAYPYARMINAADEASRPLEGLLRSPPVNSSEAEDDQA